jgi:phospholipid/cholesterol/gamma-HCH transport system substrate-binding protein
MENRSHALIAGFFTLVLLTAAILVAMWLNRDRIERVPYQLATKLSIPGLNPQAAVRYRGLDVGRVTEISFDPEVPGQILIHISVDPDTPITRSTYGTLGYQGVTGIAYIQLDDDGSKPVRLPTSEEQVARIEMRPGLLDNLENKGLAILTQAEELTKRFNTLLEPGNQQTILGAFDNVSKAATELETIPKQLKPTLDRLPKLTAEAQATLESISKLSKDVNALTAQLQAQNGPIDKIANAAEQVGSAADRIELQATPLTNDVRSTLRALDRTLERINERPQSLLFGSRETIPGPGEDGFAAPAQ